MGYLKNASDNRVNLAKNAKVSASSCKKERVSTKKVETDQNNPKPDEGSVVVASRTFTYEAGNAVDGSNGTRWMASGDDKTPSFTLDLGKNLSIKTCEMSFTFPAFGHAWILEKSVDGRHWQICGIQDEAVARSPHVAKEIGEARYLRLKIVKGNPGLWEIKVY